MPVDVHVVTPERELWSGNAAMVIARGVDGEVGIHGGPHAAAGPARDRPVADPARRRTELVAVVDGGFLHVGSSSEDATRVDVMASQAEFVDEIDVAAARARAEELSAQLERRRYRPRRSRDRSVKAELQKALCADQPRGLTSLQPGRPVGLH